MDPDYRVPIDRITLVVPWEPPCRHTPASQWHWPCPCCGQCVVATWDEHATREEIAQDGRGFYCRKQRPAGGQPAQGVLL